MTEVSYRSHDGILREYYAASRNTFYVQGLTTGGMNVKLADLFRKKTAPISDRRRQFERRSARLVERFAGVRAAFDLANDDDTIDALIYEENAVLCRLTALYKQARAEGITLDIFDRR